MTAELPGETNVADDDESNSKSSSPPRKTKKKTRTRSLSVPTGPATLAEAVVMVNGGGEKTKTTKQGNKGDSNSNNRRKNHNNSKGGKDKSPKSKSRGSGGSSRISPAQKAEVSDHSEKESENASAASSRRAQLYHEIEKELSSKTHASDFIRVFVNMAWASGRGLELQSFQQQIMDGMSYSSAQQQHPLSISMPLHPPAMAFQPMSPAGHHHIALAHTAGYIYENSMSSPVHHQQRVDMNHRRSGGRNKTMRMGGSSKDFDNFHRGGAPPPQAGGAPQQMVTMNQKPPGKGYVCKYCGEAGSHWFQQCPHTPLRTTPGPGYICKFCGAEGAHWFQQCPERAHRSSNRSQKSNKLSSKEHASKKERTSKSGPGATYACKYCGETGDHWYQQCPKAPSKITVPGPTYVCKYCGEAGKHWFQQCPKRPPKSPRRSRSRSSSKGSHHSANAGGGSASSVSSQQSNN